MKIGKFLFGLVLFVSCGIASESSYDVVKLLKEIRSDIDSSKLTSGNIVIIGREDQEKTDTSIALSFALYLKAPYKDVLNELKSSKNITSYKHAMVVNIDKNAKDLKPYFAKLKFLADEKDEVERLASYSDGDEFNLSEKEIKLLKSMRKTQKDKFKLASEFFRKVLENRFKMYLHGGIKTIASYAHSDKDSTISKGFIDSAVGLRGFKKWFPKMYNDYMNYPKTTSSDYKEVFKWIKDDMDGRITLILDHQMIREKKNILVIASRKFYMSNSLDGIATQILCIPYKDGTLVALSSQSFTPKVSGFGRSIAIEVGHKMMSKEILPLFERLKKKFNK